MEDNGSRRTDLERGDSDVTQRLDNSKKDEVAVEIKEGPPPRRSVLQRVPVPLRRNEKQKHIYDPVVVPLGPYHHGRLPEYQVAEQLKERLLDMVCGDRHRGLPLSLVSERLAEIREFYGGADGYGDQELAAMMLRDTCFVLCWINRDFRHFNVIYERIRVSGVIFGEQDMLMLENQIPLWLINLLIPFTLGVNGEMQLREFLSYMYYQGNKMVTMAKFPWGNGQGEEPLHLLEASHCMLLHLANTAQAQDHGLYGQGSSSNQTNRQPPENKWQLYDCPFRSATDLKAKGVHFRPSSQSLTDIGFFSFSTHARLHLPMFIVNHNSRVFLSNLVAYEMSSDGSLEMGVTRYVNFMKTLLRRVEDVKLLREKGILYSELADYDEVVRLFQDIDTYGISNQVDLYDLRIRMEEYCNNKGKTWLAELINTYFRSPLTAIALFVAAFILALTFLQTFYTINPRYANAAP